jgi:hypothetical protein
MAGGDVGEQSDDARVHETGPGRHFRGGEDVKPTGYYDRRGIPICVGDLVRCKHYRHRRRSEQMWLYYVVGEKGGQCVLHACFETDRSRHLGLIDAVYSNSEEWEVMAENSAHFNARGELITFNERPRRKENE